MKKTMSRLFMIMLCLLVFVGCDLQIDGSVNGSTASEEQSGLIDENSGGKTTSEEQSSSIDDSETVSEEKSTEGFEVVETYTTVLTSGGGNIQPLKTLGWSEECNASGEVILYGDGLGASGFFNDPLSEVSDLPSITATGEIKLKTLKNVEIGDARLYDLDFKELAIPTSWKELHLLPPGEYIVVFEEYVDTRDREWDGENYWRHCYENIFRLIIVEEPQIGEITSKYVVADGDKYSIILPASKKKISVYQDEVKYLWRIDDDLLKEAEKSLSRDYDVSLIILSTDKYGHLCLCVEVIVDINPPEVIVLDDGTVIDSGCNIDHKHVFHAEPITN